MKYVDADKIAIALGKMPTWPDFDVRGEIGVGFVMRGR